MNESESPFAYGSAYDAEDALTRHYGLGADLYKTWGSPLSVLSAVLARVGQIGPSRAASLRMGS